MAGEFLEFIIGVMRRNSPAIHTRLELRIQNLCSASQNSVYCQSYDGPKSKLICEILLCKLPSANDKFFAPCVSKLVGGSDKFNNCKFLGIINLQ